MRDLINTFSSIVRFFSGEITSSRVIMVVVAVSMLLPLAHLARGPKTRALTRPELVLPSYFAVAAFGLVLVAMFGVVLQSFAPDAFERWRVGFNEGTDDNPAAILMKIVIGMPIALLVSGVLYGLIGGWRKFLLSLVASPVAAAILYGIVLVGALSIACSAWSTCI